MDSNPSSEDQLRQQIRESMQPQEEEDVLVPVWFLVVREFILAIIGAGVIGYIMDFMVIKESIKFRDDVTFFPYFTCIVMVFALLAAAYRSWRIRRGLHPNGGRY